MDCSGLGSGVARKVAGVEPVSRKDDIFRIETAQVAKKCEGAARRCRESVHVWLAGADVNVSER